MLREFGYVVLEVGSGGAALDFLGEESNIDLVLLDFAMPGMNGMEVARQVHSKFPTIPVLFITGYVDQAVSSGYRRSSNNQKAVRRGRTRHQSACRAT